MGLPINNDIRIGCIISVSTPPYIETMGATFTVTDPFPVEYVNVDIDNDIMTCTWSQPSCVPVNYSYHVTINNKSLIVTDTSIQYTVASCQSYTVSVTVMDTMQSEIQSETVTRTVNTNSSFGGTNHQFHFDVLKIQFESNLFHSDIQEAIIETVTFVSTNECHVIVQLNVSCR